MHFFSFLSSPLLSPLIRLPYMVGEGRACRTEEEVRNVTDAIYRLHDFGQFNYTAACHCPPACTLSIYRTSTDTTWNTQKNSIVKVCGFFFLSLSLSLSFIYLFRLYINITNNAYFCR